MSPELSDLRTRLDGLDRQLVDLLAARQQVVGDIARLKADECDRVRDLPREEELLARLIEHGRAAGVDGYFITRLFREIIDHSIRVQQEHLAERENPDRRSQARIVVAYQGTDGAYSHMAAARHFAARQAAVVYRGFNSFQEMLDAVREGQADYAMQPIENTTAGSINAGYDLLARMDLAVVGEEIQRVDHCLLAVEEVPLGAIRRIYSHPEALAQCGEFLRTLEHCHVEAYTDTAMAARKVRDERDLSQAAIASEEAARLYGLRIIKRGVANQRENFTRFLVVAAQPARCDARIACKTSLIFATRHEEGALLKCLNILAAHHLNLTKLESRPRPNTPWEYLFYVDFEGNLADAIVEKAVRELAAHASLLKVLGSYPARTTRDGQPAEPRRPGTASAGTGVPPVATGSMGVPPVAADGAIEVGCTNAAANGQSSAVGVAQGSGAGVPDRPGGHAGPPHVAATGPDASILRMLEKKPYKLASRAGRREDSVIRVGRVEIGGPRPVIIAGPCSVETREQILACARLARELGADMLRGGCFKPRTSPYAFQGLGYEGLDLLEEAGRSVGLPIVTEVLHPADVERVARQADFLQIGARNMQNFSLLKEFGKVDRPVMLKRGMMSSIDEWLGAAEYILAHGNQQVVLCERGIRTFEDATRNTLDLSAVPVVRERTHLPVIVDPSHACGTWRWVIPMSEASLACGAHGVMVEVHPNPEQALSDGPQALTFEMFREMMERLHRRGLA